MDKGEERKKKLEDSIQRYSVLRDAHELESWINDKVRAFYKDLATTNVQTYVLKHKHTRVTIF